MSYFLRLIGTYYNSLHLFSYSYQYYNSHINFLIQNLISALYFLRLIPTLIYNSIILPIFNKRFNILLHIIPIFNWVLIPAISVQWNQRFYRINSAIFERNPKPTSLQRRQRDGVRSGEYNNPR